MARENKEGEPEGCPHSVDNAAVTGRAAPPSGEEVAVDGRRGSQQGAFEMTMDIMIEDNASSQCPVRPSRMPPQI